MKIKKTRNNDEFLGNNPFFTGRVDEYYSRCDVVKMTRYYKNGLLHREDGPAIEYPARDYEGWYKNGLMHREDGPASVYKKDGIHVKAKTTWYKYGLMHRDNNLPALIEKNRLEWWVHGKRHRTNGPAVEDKTEHNWWYINGHEIKEEAYDNIIREYKLEGFLNDEK